MNESPGDIPGMVDLIKPYQPVLLCPDSKLGEIEIEPDGAMIELRPLNLQTKHVFEEKKLGPDLLKDPSLVENVFPN